MNRKQDQEYHQYNPIHTQKRHPPGSQERRLIWILRVQRATRKEGEEQDKIHSGWRPHKLSWRSSHTNSGHAHRQTPFKCAISTKGARFMMINISDFYLMIPQKRPELIRISINNIPNKIIINRKKQSHTQHK